jgi:beta-glucosidase
VPVDGYFHWNAHDNVEWVDGYANRFALVYVDFDTQQRIPKLGAGRPPRRRRMTG